MGAKPFVVQCAHCSKPFATIRHQAKYCSVNCRTKASQARKRNGERGNVVDLPVPPAKLTYAEQFIQSVADKLKEAHRENEPLSLLALSLAEDSVNEKHPPAARKAFTAEFRATYAEAMRGVRVGSRVDGLRGRRDDARISAVG